MVQREPDATYYKPQGVPMTKLKNATLTFEELEALRLADAQGLSQVEGAEVMGVSRATFGRVLSAARTVVARALTEGLAIRIQGGHYTLADDGVWACPSMETDHASKTDGDEIMPGMKGNGSGAGGGGRCQGGQGRGMGQGGRCGGGRGMGGGGRGMGGKGMSGGNMGMGRAMDNRNSQQISKDSMMNNIAITSEGPTLDDRVDPRFGRAGGFVIVNPETMEVVQYVDNGSSQAMAQGAGIQAAENVANAGAGVLLTGYVGPKAFDALQAAGIRIGQDVDGLTVREAVNKFKAGDVAMADAANAAAGGNK
jgi:predicted DNA-binding protein (UPF0251 family)/predicted Fe-Mo cluster-binding NifX family protein